MDKIKIKQITLKTKKLNILPPPLKNLSHVPNFLSLLFKLVPSKSLET